MEVDIVVAAITSGILCFVFGFFVALIVVSALAVNKCAECAANRSNLSKAPPGNMNDT